MTYNTDYDLSWLKILRFRESKFVVYGVGQWAYHVMDWRGCNFFHGRIPDSPTFSTPEEAVSWIAKEIKAGRIYEGKVLQGHHAGEFNCPKGCDEREVSGFEQILISRFDNQKEAV
jgi:hypothetical protein